MIKRRKTRQIKVGGVRIGGGAPVSIQSMVKVETANVEAVVSEIKRLERCGCEIIRVAVKNFDDVSAIKIIKRKIKIPLVCDIHFDYRLALKSIDGGADKIRLNPGNLKNKDEIAQVVKAAESAKIPIRIGVNSGSLEDGRWKMENKRRSGRCSKEAYARIASLFSLLKKVRNQQLASSLHCLRPLFSLDF